MQPGGHVSGYLYLVSIRGIFLDKSLADGFNHNLSSPFCERQFINKSTDYIHILLYVANRILYATIIFISN
jgi:hypothetical protein